MLNDKCTSENKRFIWWNFLPVKQTGQNMLVFPYMHTRSHFPHKTPDWHHKTEKGPILNAFSLRAWCYAHPQLWSSDKLAHGERINLQLYELTQGNEEKRHAALRSRGGWIDKAHNADDSSAREEILREYELPSIWVIRGTRMTQIIRTRWESVNISSWDHQNVRNRQRKCIMAF